VLRLVLLFTMRSRRYSRRNFLRTGSASVLVAALGCSDDPRGRVDPIQRDFDLIIVGSGFAGTYLGLRALDAGLTALILEAGGDFDDPGPIAESFKVETRGDVDYPGARNRVIALGGTSNHWGGVISRPFPNDFRMRSEFGVMSDWPIGYEDLEDYLCESEQLLHVRGTEPDPGEPPRACAYPQEIALPLPTLQIEGSVPAYVPVARSRETDTSPVRLAREVIPRFERSRRATLISHEQVTELVTLDGKSIDHVRTFRPDGSIGRYGAKHYVVAAGAIESPRLLLLSRSEWHEDGLGNDHGLLGRYFGEHPSIESSYDVALDEPEGDWRVFDRIDALRREGLNGFHIGLGIDAGGRLICRVQPEIESRRENRVTLARDREDMSGNPLPAVDLSYSDRDMRTFDRIHELLATLHAELGATEELREVTRWRSHPSGACRMGASPESGVVDANNRVFGIDNLYVSGACTFTTAGTANPTNLVVAMSLRLGDIIIAAHEEIT
jgi:choline dehydrogenase-like flavoprotein